MASSEAALEDFARYIGDGRAFQESIQRMDRSARYASEHYKDWRREYPNQWVAVFDGELVGVDSSATQLLERLVDQQILLRSEFITDDVLILAH